MADCCAPPNGFAVVVGFGCGKECKVPAAGLDNGVTDEIVVDICTADKDGSNGTFDHGFNCLILDGGVLACVVTCGALPVVVVVGALGVGVVVVGII